MGPSLRKYCFDSVRPRLCFTVQVNAISFLSSSINLLPINFSTSKNLKKSGQAGILAGSLELAKEGIVSIKQNNLFEDIYIKENK